MSKYKVITSIPIIKQELEKMAIVPFTMMARMIPKITKSMVLKHALKRKAKRAGKTLAIGTAFATPFLGMEMHGKYKTMKPKIPGIS